MGVADIRICGRASQGVILMRSASEVIDIAAIAREDEDEEDGENAGAEETPPAETAETDSETI